MSCQNDNSELGSQSVQIKPQAHLISQSQVQSQSGTHFPSHFQMSQSINQPHYPQNQLSHAQFQTQLQSNTGTGVIESSSPVISTSGVTVTVKKSQQRPPPRTPGSSNANTATLLKTMELAPATRRKKTKLPDNKISDRVVSLVPESAIYNQLLDVEERISVVLARKKIDIQEALKKPRIVQKTLRIYVFNTFSDQLKTSSEGENPDPPSWTLKITGKILENGVDSETEGVIENQNPWYPKFSYFFKTITIYLDQGLYPNNHVILWENARSPSLSEGFEVTRKGDKEFKVMIRLEMNFIPGKVKLSSALTDVIGIEVDTRPRIIAAIWQYVKAKNLQNQNDPSVFTCDPSLQKIFGEEKMKFSMVSQKISQHMSTSQPIHLEHEIKLSGNSPTGTTCYDVLVDVPFQLEKEMSTFLENVDKNKDTSECDEIISTTIKKIHEHCKRQSFFLGFSQSPAEYINLLMDSQSKDLKLAAGDPSQISGKESRSDFYNQTWVEDAVNHYLNRKPVVNAPP